MFNVISDILSFPAENHYHHLTTLEREEFKEKIWLNLEIIGNGAEAESIKRIIQISFEDIFFTDPYKDTYERFEETLKEINLLLKNLKEKNEAQNFCRINGILAIQENGNLHLTQTGEAEAYLVRNRKLTVISEGLSGRKKEESDVFLNIASGELTFGDTLVFSSCRLLRYYTGAQLGEIFSQNIPEALEEIKQIALEAVSLAVTGIRFKRSVFTGAKNRNESVPIEKTRILENEPLQKLKVFFDKFVDFLARKMDKNPAKVEKFSLLTGIAIIGIVLVLSIALLFSNNQDKQKYAEYSQIITSATEELEKAEKFALMEDKETANAITKKVEGKVTQILNEGYFRTESLKILEKVRKLEDDINNIQRISNPKVLADLSGKRNGINLLGLTSLNDHLFAFEYNALYETILDKVENPLTISDTEKTVEMQSMPEKNLLLLRTATDKIIEFKEGQFSFANTADAMWKKGAAMAVYSKYLYLLSPQENQIWKYEKRKNQYDTPAKYNLDADLSKGIDLAIDGSVFVLNEGGEITKIYRGNRQEFGLKNFPAEEKSQITKIFTLPDQANLYLLNPQKNSILIVKKLPASQGGQGAYQRQIMLEGTGKIVDLYVDQNEQKMFVLDQTKIYEIGL